MKRISLEQQAIEVCDANSVPPFIFQLPPDEGREILEKAQSLPVCMYQAEVVSLLLFAVSLVLSYWNGGRYYNPFAG